MTAVVIPEYEMDEEGRFSDSPFLEEHGSKKEDAGIPAVFVHEHAKTGFLADLVVPENITRPEDPLLVVFEHSLLGKEPVRVRLRIPDSGEPVQYAKLMGLIRDYPVVLRTFWLHRLRSACADHTTIPPMRLSPIGVIESQEGLVSRDSFGVMLEGEFAEFVPPESPLPFSFKTRCRTTRANQKAISIIPAVKSLNKPPRVFNKIRLDVLPAAGGICWFDMVFRVDPDGLCMIVALDPLLQMRARSVTFVG